MTRDELIIELLNNISNVGANALFYGWPPQQTLGAVIITGMELGIQLAVKDRDIAEKVWITITSSPNMPPEVIAEANENTSEFISEFIRKYDLLGG